MISSWMTVVEKFKLGVALEKEEMVIGEQSICHYVIYHMTCHYMSYSYYSCVSQIEV